MSEQRRMFHDIRSVEQAANTADAIERLGSAFVASDQPHVKGDPGIGAKHDAERLARWIRQSENANYRISVVVEEADSDE